ncbi:MAG TPA: hypothetical protein VF808_15810 [Ktedonobacterales bacterium]
MTQQPDAQRALIPLAEALPDFQADRYTKVRAWDAARMALAGDYDRADGEYLMLIRDELQRLHGARTPLWKAYLHLRDIPYDTAHDRIRKAEGRPHRHMADNGDSPLSIAPASQSTPTAPTPTRTLAPDDEPVTAEWVEDAREPEPESEPDAAPSKVIYSVLDWKALSPATRAAEIALGRDHKAALNKQDTTHIEWAQWSWNPVTGCLHNCPYCLEGSTPILLANGRTLPISALRVGDAILGTHLENGYRRVVETTVLAHWRTVEEAVRITLEDCRQFVCSGNHRWLTPRGWKYTLDGQITRDEQGWLVGQRPHLTPNDQLFGFGTAEQTPAETDEYRRGYLSGVIRGDGHLKQHRDQRRQNSYYWSFRLAMKDGEAVARAKRYLQSFGVETQDFAFAMVSGGAPAIRTSSRASFETITSIIEWSDTPEYYRGLLAGLFDAEGHGSAGGKTFRIYNSNPDILAYCEKALAHWRFQSVYDTDKISRNVYY